MPKLRSISPRMRRFCELIVTGKYTQAEAHKLAGYSKGGGKRTHAEAGNKLLKQIQIQKYIEKLTLEAARIATLTAAKVIGDIDRLREKAEKKGKMNIALKASELEGKYLGLFQEQIIPTSINVTIKKP